MAEEIPPEVALSWMRLQTVKYVNVASLAILVFDYCLTFDLELSLIWPTKMSLMKTLFLFARYTPFFDVPVGLYYTLAPNVSLKDCFNLNTTATTMSVFGIAIGEAILVLRTFAPSGRDRNVLLIIGTIYALAASATLVMVGIFLRSMTFGPPIFSKIPGCNETGGNFILIGICFILVLVNETALMSFTLWLGWKRYRTLRNPFVVTLYRDGITYFIFLTLGSATNFAILIAGEVRQTVSISPFQRSADNTTGRASGTTKHLPISFLRVMHSVLSTRILLHLRDVERKRAEASLQLQVSSGTHIDFAPGYEDT
ncbi:hypothetical protein GGX14DRAFT_546981 [Mycena pura]|uniref:DUF6533 domain-containing protein n=1 Tax=Mycena pura TaxID=153505 RepID=A0AAD6XXT9_9AGAR|nr:hypothetical protein GGX14DRAFT_546981 [Mycena pura]